MLTYRPAPDFSTATRRVVTDGIGLFLKAVCTGCDGTGTMTVDDGVDGFQRTYSATCDCCDGDGYTYAEVSEDALLEGVQ